jgi:hypothetical protein
MTETGNRENNEILSMSGPMPEQAPDIRVTVDGPARRINNCFVILRDSEYQDDNVPAGHWQLA